MSQPQPNLKAPIVPPRGRLLPASKAAVRLGIGVAKLYRLIKAHEIVFQRRDNGRLEGLYERDLDEWIERRRQPIAPRPEPSRVVARDVDAAVDALVSADERVW
jgi:excisionase family DNA binding protein